MVKDKKKLSYFRPNKKYKQLGLKYCKNKKENKNYSLHFHCYRAFTLDVKLVFSENLGGILGGTSMLNGL